MGFFRKRDKVPTKEELDAAAKTILGPKVGEDREKWAGRRADRLKGQEIPGEGEIDSVTKQMEEDGDFLSAPELEAGISSRRLRRRERRDSKTPGNETDGRETEETRVLREMMIGDGEFDGGKARRAKRRDFRIERLKERVLLSGNRKWIFMSLAVIAIVALLIYSGGGIWTSIKSLIPK